MEITLTPDIEQALLVQAKQRGTTPEELALETLRQQFVLLTQSETPVETAATLADFLGGFIGVLHSEEYVHGGARMSKATSKTFGEALLRKREQGHL